MGNLFKKGSDNLLNGIILGGVIGVLIAVGDFSGVSWLSWITGIRDSVMNALATQTWLDWAKSFRAVVVFGVIGAVFGYLLDRS